MGLIPIPIFGINFYGADFLIILLSIAIFTFGLKYLANSIIASFLFFFIMYGLISLLFGLFQGHEINYVFGAFRRIFFYSLAFALTWNILNSPQRVLLIHKYIYFAAIPVVILSLLRLWKGVSWRPSEEDLRVVSYSSVTILFLTFYDSITRIISRRDQNRNGKYYLWLIVVILTLVISNYRTLWLIPIAGLMGILWILWRRGDLRNARTLKSILLIFLVCIVVVLLLIVFLNDLYLLLEQKFVNDVLGFRFTNSFRYFVWGQAWKEFTSNELLGVGIGKRLEYDLLNTEGNWYARISTTHNILLEILYQTGLIGFVLFLIPHLFFFSYVWLNIRNLPQLWMRPTLAYFFTYLSMLALGMFEPFLAIPSVAVLFYALMGITVRFVFWGKRESRQKEMIFEHRDF